MAWSLPGSVCGNACRKKIVCCKDEYCIPEAAQAAEQPHENHVLEDHKSTMVYVNSDHVVYHVFCVIYGFLCNTYLTLLGSLVRRGAPRLWF
jgi:hypothetical protein